MNRIDRLFGVLTLLQAKKYVTADVIAEKYEISIRTVYRDIRALVEQGIPVGFEPAKGYFLVRGFFLPPVSFSAEEANALLLMETMVYGFADKSVGHHYSAALNKIKAVLRTRQKEELDQLSSQMILQLPGCYEPATDHLSALQGAISARTMLEISYTDMKGRTTLREIEAIGLIFYAFSWHLIAWCHLRGEYRDFRVSRIMEVRNLQRPFSVPDHMELKDYLKNLPVAY
ncbi:MAG TPA: YafY family protein [Sphingobacteriaceae bacterium]